jgi:imidazolonepropionase-like amidohydrolase
VGIKGGGLVHFRRLIVALGAFAATPAFGQPAEPLAIVGATVLPMEGPERLTDQTVIVRGDRIEQVGPRSRIKVPANARRIDARGQTLMPGLVDMHIHLSPVNGEAGDAAQRALAVMLAHGVTTARGMAGSPGNLVVRGKIEAGELAGPRLYAAAPALHDKNTPTAEQGREAVRKAAAAQFDLIKSHELSDPLVWQAVADEARKAVIPTAGHVNNAVGLDRAFTAGQQVEHLDGFIAEIVKLVAPGQSLDWGQVPPPPVIATASKVSDTQLAQIAAKAAAARSWQVPTLSLFEKIADVTTPAERLMTNPDFRYVPPQALKQWAAQLGELKEAGYTAADAAAFTELRRRIVKALRDARVPLMAGSDTAQAFQIWGPGLHQEVRALAAAGLSPMDALKAATVVPRDYFRSLPNGGSARGWKADFGTIAPGARADLILLGADPSRNLDALKRPNMVIARGRLFDRPTLDAMLEKVIADANRPAK